MKLGLAVLIALVLAAPASAASWGAPQPLYAPRPITDPPYPKDNDPGTYGAQLGFGDDGTAVALVYASYDYACEGDSHCDFPEELATTVHRPGGDWTGLASWVDRVEAPELTVETDGSPFVASYGTEEIDLHYFPATVRVQGGELWRGDPTNLNSAIDRNGSGLVTWEHFGYNHPRFYAVQLRRGQVDGRRIRTRGAAVPGVGSAGDEVLAWREGHWIYDRVARPGGAFGRTERVGPIAGHGTDARAVVVDAAGRATLLWTSRHHKRIELWSAQARRGGTFAVRRRLDTWRGGEYDPSPLVATAGAPGEVLVAWSPDGRGVHAMTSPGRQTTIGAPASGVVQSIDALPDGRAALLVASGRGTAASVRSSGRAFGPLEVVDAQPPGEQGDIAMDPATGEPGVVGNRVTDAGAPRGVWFSERSP